MKQKLSKTLILTLFVFWANQAAAYIDPGTGGTLATHIGTILAAVATASLAAVAYLRTAIKNALRKALYYAKKSSATYTVTFLSVMAISSTMAIHNYRNYANGGIMNGPTKVIIIGIDGFDPDIMEYLMAQGKLPNFKRLANTGSYHRLRTIDPPISPVVWTTIATGMNPDHHNIYDFMRFDKKEMLPYLSVIDQKNTITGTRYNPPIKAETFWEQANKTGTRAAVIRWPLTFPATKIDGTMISGFGTPDIRGYLGGYSVYTDDNDKIGTEEEIKPIITSEHGKKTAHIYGPPKINGKPSEIEMEIAPAQRNTIQITIQGTTYSLIPHFWSQWVPLEFHTSIGQTVKAQTRFYLEETTPHIQIFTTSIQADPKNPAMPISYPSPYSKELAARNRDSFYTLGMPEDIKAVNDEKLTLRALLQQASDIHNERAAMFMEAYDRMVDKQIGLIAIVFDETDRVQHLTVATQTTRRNGTVTSTGPAIEQLYIQKDTFIGEVLNKLQEGTALIVISDHGFKPFTKTININTWLHQQGYLAAQTGASANSRPLYKDVVWSRTKAYSYGYVGININISGRESAGIVNPSDKDRTEQEITKKLYDMTDPQTNDKVIDKVIPTARLYNGPFSKNAPDLIVLPRPPYRIDWQSPIGQMTEKAIYENTRIWGADHMYGAEHVPGIFFANFKVTDSPAVWDIAPTVAALIDTKEAVAYSGKPLIRQIKTKGSQNNTHAAR